MCYKGCSVEWFFKAWAALDWFHRIGALAMLGGLLFFLAPAFSQLKSDTSRSETKQPRAADGAPVTIRGGDGGPNDGRGGDVSIRGGDGGPNGARGGDVTVRGGDGGNVNMGDKTIIINNGALQQGGQGNVQNNTFVNRLAGYEKNVGVQYGGDGALYVARAIFHITPNRRWGGDRSALTVQTDGAWKDWDVEGFGSTIFDPVQDENPTAKPPFVFSTTTTPAGREVVARLRSERPLKIIGASGEPGAE